MRVLFKGLLKCFRAHIPGIRLRVNKHRRGILVNNRVTGCTERKRRGKYHISRPHSQDAQRQVDSRSTCAERSGMGNAHISCQFLFKLINIRPSLINFCSSPCMVGEDKYTLLSAIYINTPFHNIQTLICLFSLLLLAVMISGNNRLY